MLNEKYKNHKRNKLKPYFSDKLYLIHKFHSTSFTKEKDSSIIKNKRKTFSFNSKKFENKINESIQEWFKYKSYLYLKRKKEEQKNNKILNEEIKGLKRSELNYSQILKLVGKAMNEDNPFNDSGFKIKMNIYKNKKIENQIKYRKIKENLIKKILFGSKIKSKVDSGIAKESGYEKLYQKIKNLKRNLERKKLFGEKSKSTINKNKGYFIVKEKQYKNKRRIIPNNSHLLKLKEEKIASNRSSNLDQTIISYNNDSLFNLNDTKKLENQINRSNNFIEIENLSKIKDLNNELFYNKLKNLNNKTFHFKNKKFNESMFSNNSKSSENFKQISTFRSTSKIEFKGRRKINKYNNLLNKTTKFVSNNKGRSKFKSKTMSGKNKMSKYISSLNDFYKNFKRINIKTNTLKYKTNNWEIPSYKKADSAINSNKDMLIFKLRQKYLNNEEKFLGKNKVNKSHKLIIKKLKEKLAFIDDEKS